MRRSRKCPVCNQTGIPIVYGYPSSGVFQAADEGLLAIGGCIVSEDEPTWWCEKDRVGWEGPDPSRAIREVLDTGAVVKIPRLQRLRPGFGTVSTPEQCVPMSSKAQGELWLLG